MSEKKWRLEVKIIYEDDYETWREYDKAIYALQELGYEYLTETTGYDNHGGYCILAKSEE